MFPKTEQARVHGFIPSKDLDFLLWRPDYFSIRIFLEEGEGRKAYALAPATEEIPSQQTNQYFVEETEWQGLIAYSRGDLCANSAAYNITMNKRAPSLAAKNLREKKKRRAVTRVVTVLYRHGIKNPSAFLWRDKSSSKVRERNYIAITLVPAGKPARVDA